MHRLWEPILEPLLDSLQPRVIVEVGAAEGHNTRNLLEFARRNGAVVHVIDPSPAFKVDDWESTYGDLLQFHGLPSLEALPSIEDAEVVFIDGDHNWHTVYNELATLAEVSKDGQFPVVVLHDVAWPYGRRDLYYEPDRIPEPHRQPYRQAGIRPGREDLDPDGGLNFHLRNAVVSGGPRNGVLTAIEDFIHDNDGVGFLVVPGFHGVAIVFPLNATSLSERTSEFLRSVRLEPPIGELLERLEWQRVKGVVEVGDLARELAARSRANQETGDALEAAEARATGLQRRLESAEAVGERLAQQLSRSEKTAASARRSLDVLQRRRSVRMALRLARLFRPAILALRSLRKLLGRRVKGRDDRTVGRPRLTVPQVVQGVEATRQRRYPIDGPLVSVIVLTRNGADRLRILFEALGRSEYKNFEVIVIDNASTDHTSGVLTAEWPFSLRAEVNDQNVSFSRGNNQGVAVAQGELLLFLNNDVEPFVDTWLAAMVDAIEDPDTAPAAVGAVLVYPEIGDPARDLTVQHTGVRFGFRASAPHAYNMASPDPTDPDLTGVRQVPGVSAAAMMVRRSTFDAVGGFALGYVYGAEDVDLCLKLSRFGPLMVQGDAVLWHHESATQATLPPEQVRAQRRLNWRQYAEAWGPTITRSVRRDRLIGSGRWTGAGGPPKVAITLTEDNPEKGYGDYYTAHELGDALEAAGWEVHYAERFRDRWYELPDDLTMVVGLLDSFDVRTVGSEVVRVAWVRNWVDRWLDRGWLSAYDVVVVGSDSAKRAIARAGRFDPPVLPLAANTERFGPGPAVSEFVADYVFTGNNWGAERSLLTMLEVRPGERFAVYGKDWDRDPRAKQYWRGHLEYGRLPELYRSVKIVLDDTAGPTISHGFLNSRVFDALAAGALVVTNNRAGSDELFDGLLPVYEDAESLRALLDHYLANEGERIALVESLRHRVLAEHTYDQRAIQFIELAKHVVEAPRLAVKIGAPDPETAHHWGDFHFANSLVRAMSKQGFVGEVHLLPDWDLPSHQMSDVVIHLRGLSRYRPKPSAVNVLWVISHPEDVTEEEANSFDLVCVASRLLAESWQERLDVPVVYLPQATDALRFGTAQVDEDLLSDVLFVGNTRNQRRVAVDWAVQAGLPLTVYGLGWERKLPRGCWLGRYFPNDRLGDLYASAKVVLNDHWPDMRRFGIVSNRVLDVLGAGGVVVSDETGGLPELLGDAIPTFRNEQELSKVVGRLLSDASERQALAEQGRGTVLGAHTFEHRAQQLNDLIGALLEGRAKDVDGHRFEL